MSRRRATVCRLVVDGKPSELIVRRCNRFFERLAGLALLGAGSLAEAVWLEHCRAIHTTWMRDDIDIAFLDEKGYVLRVSRAVPARRIRALRSASAVLEAPVGRLECCGLRSGLRLSLEALPDVAPRST